MVRTCEKPNATSLLRMERTRLKSAETKTGSAIRSIGYADKYRLCTIYKKAYLETYTRFTNVYNPSPNAVDSFVTQHPVWLDTSIRGSIEAKDREAGLNEFD